MIFYSLIRDDRFGSLAAIFGNCSVMAASGSKAAVLSQPLLPFHTSVCSANSSASSTSTPRYLTVLSSLACPSRSCTALRFYVRRYIRDALGLRKEWVPYLAGSSPMPVTQDSTIRAYCRLETCADVGNWLGNRKLAATKPANRIHVLIASRVCAVNSN
jgi:hypothetical protein